MEESYLLQKIGLTNSESKVYLALLELGLTTTGPIVDKSEIASSKIYEILERLTNKGLVSFVRKGNTKYFQASPAERLLDYVEEKERKIKQEKNQVKQLLPMLKEKRKIEEQNATIYRGMNGLHTAFYSAVEELRKGDCVKVMGVPERSKKANLFFLKYNLYLEKKGISMKVLFDESAKGQPQTRAEKVTVSEIKWMPKGILTPAAINVFKETTLIFPLEENSEPLIIAIKSRNVADSFRAQFDLLWNMEFKEALNTK